MWLAGPESQAECQSQVWDPGLLTPKDALFLPGTAWMEHPPFPIRATEVVRHPLLTSQQAQGVSGKAGPAHICFWGGNLFISAFVPFLVWTGLLPPLSIQEGPTSWGPLSYCTVKFGFDVFLKALKGFLPTTWF